VSVTLDGGGARSFPLTLERSGEWVALAKDHAKRLEQLLQSTSFVTACADGYDPTLLLVWEDGMPQKPSLLFTMSATDILRYWLSSPPSSGWHSSNAAAVRLMPLRRS
jgi:hypothetical protein